MVAPTIDTITPSSSEGVTVEFDQAMLDDAIFLDPASYTIPGLDVLGVTFTAPNIAELETFPEMRQGVTYALTVDPDIKNAGSEPMDPTGLSGTFTGAGVEPTLDSVTPQSSVKIRVTFSEMMKKNDALLDVASYAIRPTTPGAALVYLQEVIAPPAARPTFVDIVVTEMQDGATYEVTATALEDWVGNVMTAPSIVTFTGQGLAPAIIQVQAISLNRVDIKFNGRMLDNSDIRNPAKYAFTGGLTVLSVLDVDGDTVQLVTSDQAPDTVYTLTISP